MVLLEGTGSAEDTGPWEPEGGDCRGPFSHVSYSGAWGPGAGKALILQSIYPLPCLLVCANPEHPSWGGAAGVPEARTPLLKASIQPTGCTPWARAGRGGGAGQQPGQIACRSLGACPRISGCLDETLFRDIH